MKKLVRKLAEPLHLTGSSAAPVSHQKQCGPRLRISQEASWGPASSTRSCGDSHISQEASRPLRLTGSREAPGVSPEVAEPLCLPELGSTLLPD